MKKDVPEIIIEVADKAQLKWAALYSDEIEVHPAEGAKPGPLYAEYDRLYALILAAREARRISKQPDAMVVLEDRASLAYFDWCDWPTPAGSGRAEGLRHILAAVDGELNAF